MFGRSPKEKYQHYLRWFNDQVKDKANWATLRQDKDCANYNHPDQVPVPYEMGEALFRMGDPKKMAKAVSKYQERTKSKILESYKYVGGNPANDLLDPEYLKNDQILQEARKTLQGYTGDKDFASDELFRMAKQAEAQSVSVTKHLKSQTDKMNGKDPVQSIEQSPVQSERWEHMTWYQALWHWLKGNKVQQINESNSPSWRDIHRSR